MAGAGAIRAGKAFVEISADNSKLLAGLKRAQVRLQSFGAAVTSFGTKLLGAGAGAASLFAVPIMKAGDFGETVSKFETVFGENAASVREWSDEFAERVGRSKAEVLGFLADTRGLIDPLGYDPASADALSKDLTQLAVDLASFNNTSDADAAAALKSGLLGESEPLKRFGIILNETTAKAQAALDGVDWESATAGEKALARWQVIQKGAGKAVGDAERTSGSFSNQMKALKGEVNDAAIAVGEALIPSITPLIGYVAKAIKEFAGWASENKELIGTVFQVAAGVAVAGAALTGIGLTISALGAGVGGIISAFGFAATVIGAIVSPIGLVTAGAIAGVAAFLKYTDTGKGIATQVGSAFSSLWKSISSVFGKMKEALAAGQWTLAGNVAMAALKAAWAAGVHKLNEMWINLSTGVLNAFDETVADLKLTWIDLKIAWVNLVDSLKFAWFDLLDAIKNRWIDTKGFLAGGFLRLQATLDPTFDQSGALKTLQEDLDRERQLIAAAQQDREQARDADLETQFAPLRDERRIVQEQASRTTGERTAFSGGRIRRSEAEMEKAANDLTRAMEAVDLATAGDANAAYVSAMKELDARTKGGPGEGNGPGEIAKSVTGTFSSYALRGLGGGSAAEKTAKNTETVAGESKKQTGLLQKIVDRPTEAVFGP